MNTQKLKKTSRQDWHPAKIKMELAVRGITLKAIAEVAGLADSTSLSMAMTRSLPSGERRIAEALGVHPKDIWPSRYFDDGTPKPRGIRALQFNATARMRNVKVAAAA